MTFSPPLENVLPAGADTVLTISGFGNMIYQARKLNQTLEPIAAASQLERTISGKYIDVSAPQFQKYQTKIVITDEVDAPPLDGIFPGMEVTIHCAVEFCYPIGRVGSPRRPVVSGSDYTQNGYNFYRPSLLMLIKDVQENLDEWGRRVGWTLDAEEV